jgi:poly(U)-specific endoribonuclease
VFVGEGREDAFIGLHNWLQFYLQEKAGNIDYHGYFRRDFSVSVKRQNYNFGRLK